MLRVAARSSSASMRLASLGSLRRSPGLLQQPSVQQQQQQQPSRSVAAQVTLPSLTPQMVAQMSTACRRVTLKAPAVVAPQTASTPLRIPSRVIAPFMPVRALSTDRVKERTREQQKQDEAAQVVLRAPSTARPPTMGMTSYPPITVTTEQLATDKPLTTGQTVIANAGLSAFLGRVYRTTGLSVGASLALAYGLAVVGVTPAIAIGGFVMSLGSVLALGMGKKPPTLRRADDPTKLYTVNSAGRMAIYAAFVAGNSAMLAPAVAMTLVTSPWIVPAAVGATGLTMFGASAYAYMRPSGSMVKLAAPMMGALVGLIGLQLASIGALYFVGANAFSAAMMTATPYLGIGIFSALTAVDTHTAVAEYEAGQADHLQHSVSFFLNAINLLISFMRIFSSKD